MLTFSVFISLISVALAIGMAAVVVHVLRAERRRSEARVAALSQMAMADFLPEPELVADVPMSAVEVSDDLFTSSASPSPWRTRFVIAGALAALMIVVVAAASVRPTLNGAVANQAEEAMPLELTALDHAQDGASLIVGGRVRNPAGAPTVGNLTATVFLFGQDGAFLTSGRSPLDVGALGGGVESGFTVTIPVNGTVARYRVSFRDSSGHPVAHVDRRSTPALARKE